MENIKNQIAELDQKLQELCYEENTLKENIKSFEVSLLKEKYMCLKNNKEIDLKNSFIKLEMMKTSIDNLQDQITELEDCLEDLNEELRDFE